MAKKFLKFIQLKDTAENPCYQVKSIKDDFLGDLYFEKITPRSKFELTFNPVSVSRIGDYVWWNADCLIALVEFMKKETKKFNK